jgi:1-phosphofructokinase family hexose kinase
MKNNKIITLTLNPAIDHIFSVDSLLLYNKNVIRDLLTFYGGKGINVAFALGKLHANCTATGFIGENDLAAVTNKLASEHVKSEFVSIQGSTRSNYKVMDIQKQKDTEFNQAGFSVQPEDINRLQHLFDSLFMDTGWLAISGSLPPGIKAEFYRDLIAAANKSGLQTCLDTSGEALKAGITGKPTLLRINRSELEEAAGQILEDNDQIQSAITRLITTGIEMVVVSMGQKGVLASNSTSTFMAIVPKVEITSLTGAGDTLTAGFLHALTQGKSFQDALLFGSSLATASTLKLEPGDFNPDDHARILKDTIMKQLA